MRRTKKKNILLLLLLLIVGLSVGYALLTTNLTINGSSKIKQSTWDIHFENLNVTDGSVLPSDGEVAAAIDSNTTEVSYAITLKQPGDFYEFTVDAVNAGSIDGMVESVTSKLNDTVITTLPTYLDYSVSYIDGVEILPNQLLKAGEVETYKVRIEFKKDIESTNLPTTTQTLSFDFGVVYIQADDTSVVRPMSLYNHIANQADLTQTIDFTQMAFSDSNGKGIYRFPNTENTKYPIYYYRGNISNNFVGFADKCWQIVRTTDTGGVKLVYYSEKDSTYNNIDLRKDAYQVVTNTVESKYIEFPFTTNMIYETSTNSWSYTFNGSNNHVIEFSFRVKNDDNYFISVSKNTYEGSGSIIIYKNEEEVSSSGIIDYTKNYSSELDSLKPSDTIKIVFNGVNFLTDGSSKLQIKIQKKGTIKCHDVSYGKGITSESDESKFMFGYDYKYPTFAGYMFGDTYQVQQTNYSATNYLFGKSFDYIDNHYILKDTAVEVSNDRHYTCFNTSGECSNINYVFAKSASTHFYINFSGGKNIEQAFDAMKENRYDSAAKAQIDSWYERYLVEYSNYLEDTIWCNDRSMGNSTSGWVANGGNLTEKLEYSPLVRMKNGTPNLNCPDKNDAFTVNNTKGNQKLKYPIALLTADELLLSGEKYKGGDYSSINGSFSWSMSPLYIDNPLGGSFGLIYSSSNTDTDISEKNALRPSVSLKEKTIFIKGDGTRENPYIIE